MKEFNNKTDREYLRILNEMSSTPELNLGVFLSKCVLNKGRVIQVDNAKTTLLFNLKNDTEALFTYDLTKIISLIEILKKEDLIFIHTNPDILGCMLHKKSDISQPVPAGGEVATILTNDDLFQEKILQSPTNYAKWVLPTTLSNYILEYINQFCYIRPELTDYIIADFNTYEQLRFKKTILWTQITAGIAFIGLLIALIIPFLSQNQKSDRQINKTQQPTCVLLASGLKSVI